MDFKKIDKVFDYASYSNDEYSSFCQDLCQIARAEGYGSKEFFKAVDKELDAVLKNFNDNTRIVEKSEERVIRKSKIIEWKGIDFD